MKKIIISKKQFKSLNEDNSIDVTVTAKGQNSSDFINAATSPEATSDIQKAKKYAQDVNLKVNGPDGNNDSEPTIDVEVPKGSTVQKTIPENPSIEKAIEGGSSVKISGDGFGKYENRVYSKKSIEEARLENIRKNGISLTKKELSEIIINSY